MTTEIRPGLLVLHGNRLERLAETVLAWLQQNPLAPLEAETWLVPSNGMAEWLKIEAARAHGVFAAARVELPARFLWRAYRAVLGAGAVPAVAPLDEAPLVWRLMAQLPARAAEPGFEPVAGFLAAADATAPGAAAARRLQLARRLADLFDGYQVHRPDWLADWAAGRDRLGPATPLPPGQDWQPRLWRALLASLPEAGAGGPGTPAASRALLHQRFLQALEAGPPAGGWRGLPRRVVLFGSTQLPLSALEALAGLARCTQVLVAVPNPCRHHWADLLDGPPPARGARHRHRPRGGVDLSAVAPEDRHAHGHPLLAAWGRQARDFIRQLDAYDDVQQAHERFPLPRLDLFDAAPGTTLLAQVQAAIRDGLPLAEHPRPLGLPPPDPADRSIAFHVAHSAQREVEILHDQLLQHFALPPRPGERALAPRDVVVMVPDVETFAPAIRAVFGAHAPGEPRHIPWGITDLSERGRRPLLVWLEALLQGGARRFTAPELMDALDVPAVARRLALAPGDAAQLAAWVEGAGIRWGLDAAHRGALGLGAAGEVGSWAFGLRRMLLGWAVGERGASVDAAAAPGGADAAFADIEPYAEVGGLSAALAGTLAEWLERLAAWVRDAATERSPADWAARLRQLLAEQFAPASDDDRALLAALDEALARWLADAEAGGFDAPVPLAVAADAWLDALDAPASPGQGRRFRAGGVTFCTLLPMRAIPFELVCLLGMNDGDYPRRAPRNDFDLMALPGQARPGDRSRRDDDRQLMLDALLAARRALHVSWTGRSVRDNQAQPPSVLVAQLRDHLDAGYGAGLSAALTTEHPLQPFSRRYFEQAPPAGATGPGLYTWAGEWRAAHAEPGAVTPSSAPALATGRAPVAAAFDAAVSAATPAAAAAPRVASLDALAGFLRRPVRSFFRERLRTAFDDAETPLPEAECFDATGGLVHWGLVEAVLQMLPLPQTATRLRADGPAALAADVDRALARLAGRGALPLGAPGRQARAALRAVLLPLVQQAAAALAERPHALERLPLRFVHPADAGLALADALGDLRAGAGEPGEPGEPGAEPWRIERVAQRVAARDGKALRLVGHPLVGPWLRALAAAACGRPVQVWVFGEGASVRLPTPPAEAAAETLAGLLAAWRDTRAGDTPPPVALKTALELLADPDSDRRARQRYDGVTIAGGEFRPGEGAEPELARLWPDFDRLVAEPAFTATARRLYGDFAAALAEADAQAYPGVDDAASAGDADG